MGHDRRDVCAHARVSDARVRRAGRSPPPPLGQRRRHASGAARGTASALTSSTSRCRGSTLRAFKVARERPRGLSGVAFLYGYLRSAVRRVPRVEDRGVPRLRPA